VLIYCGGECPARSRGPDITPTDFALFPRAMPAARPPRPPPASVAATAGGRMGMRAARRALHPLVCAGLADGSHSMAP